MTEEVWKNVKGYEGLYEVSTYGRVRRLTVRDNKPDFRILKKHYTNRSMCVTLFKHGKGKVFTVGRLVAMAFIDNPLGLNTVHHKDGNHANNNIDNLEWCTRGYTLNHFDRNRKIAESKGRKVLCYDLDMNLLHEYPSTRAASRILNIKQTSIQRCCTGGYWSRKYNKFININKAGKYIFKYETDKTELPID